MLVIKNNSPLKLPWKDFIKKMMLDIQVRFYSFENYILVKPLLFGLKLTGKHHVICKDSVLIYLFG